MKSIRLLMLCVIWPIGCALAQPESFTSDAVRHSPTTATQAAIVTPTDHHPQQQEEIVMAMLIEPGRVECLHLPVHNPKHASFELDYQVIEGGENDISFLLKNPSGVVVAQDVKRMDGAHKIDVAHEQNGYGDYAFCFDNSFSVRTAKRVFFEIFLLDKEGNYLSDYDLKELGEKAGRSENLEAFQRSTSKVKQNLNEVERMQSQLRAMEARDRALMEGNLGRVNWWSSLHLVCLLSVAAIQVFMVRSLFTEDSKIGRVMRGGGLH